MIACFGSIAHAPLAVMLMVAEMTTRYCPGGSLDPSRWRVHGLEFAGQRSHPSITTRTLRGELLKLGIHVPPRRSGSCAENASARLPAGLVPRGASPSEPSTRDRHTRERSSVRARRGRLGWIGPCRLVGGRVAECPVRCDQKILPPRSPCNAGPRARTKSHRDVRRHRARSMELGSLEQGGVFDA
jgi:hypothetical protein